MRTPATTFILWVLVGTAPPYERGTFPTYERWVEAGIGQAESLRSIEGLNVTWQCLPISNDADAR